MASMSEKFSAPPHWATEWTACSAAAGGGQELLGKLGSAVVSSLKPADGNGPAGAAPTPPVNTATESKSSPTASLNLGGHEHSRRIGQPGHSVPQELPLDRWRQLCRTALQEHGKARRAEHPAVLPGRAQPQSKGARHLGCDGLLLDLHFSRLCRHLSPRTPLGKIIGSALMTIGPSLAARVMDGEGTAASGDTQQEMLHTLRQILDRLPRPEDVSAG